MLGDVVRSLCNFAGKNWAEQLRLAEFAINGSESRITGLTPFFANYAREPECASLPPASSSLTHARRMDGFCNQNADQLGYLAGPSLLTVYVGVVECASTSPYTYSTHRFPD